MEQLAKVVNIVRVRKAVSLLANVHLILGVGVFPLYFLGEFVQRRRKKDRFYELQGIFWLVNLVVVQGQNFISTAEKIWEG